MSKRAVELAEALLRREAAVSTSRLGRLVSSGRAAVGLAATVLRRGEPNLELVERLTGRLGELKGLGMKVGQIFSYVDPSLPPEARQLLAVLQTRAPASPFDSVERTLRAAFGPRADVLLGALERAPVAVASIAQVHRADLPGVGLVAVKVRHEGIVQALEADLASVRGSLRVADTVMLGMASAAYEQVAEVREVLLGECDLAREAGHQRRFAAWLAADPTLLVPQVVDAWSADAVLTTRWEPGDGLDAFLARRPAEAERARAAEALFRASVGGLYSLGLLAADPHPGNFAFRDGRVVLYDFGCVRRFEPVHVAALADLVAALRRDDVAALTDAGRRFGFDVATPERVALLQRFARAFFQPMLVRGPSVIPQDGPVELRQLMADKLALARLGLPRHALFLLRLRFGLYAVLSRLGARLDWGGLEERYAADTRAAA